MNILIWTARWVLAIGITMGALAFLFIVCPNISEYLVGPFGILIGASTWLAYLRPKKKERDD